MKANSDIMERASHAAESKHFSLDEANRALPYIRRIVEDIRVAYRSAVQIQERLDQHVPIDDLDLVKAEYDQAIHQLNRYLFELQEVGVELKDYEVGLIDFPAMHCGRTIYFCWKAGEDKILAWHERDAGFAGRQDIRLIDHEDHAVA